MTLVLPVTLDESGRVLITSRSLATGRTLRHVAPQALTEDELISFWADDEMMRNGCQLPVS